MKQASRLLHSPACSVDTKGTASTLYKLQAWHDDAACVQQDVVPNKFSGSSHLCKHAIVHSTSALQGLQGSQNINSPLLLHDRTGGLTC